MEYEDHPLLPSNAPKGQPHIIKDSQQNNDFLYDVYETDGKPNLCDFIATVLHRLKDHPTALHDFFDQTITSFKFLRVEKKDGPYMSSMIWRMKNQVMVCLDKQTP